MCYMNYNFLYYKIWCDFRQLHRFSSTSGSYILPSKRFKLPGASVYAQAKYDVEVASDKSYNGCSARTVLNGAKCQAMLFSHLGGPALKTYGILNVWMRAKRLSSLSNSHPEENPYFKHFYIVMVHLLLDITAGIASNFRLERFNCRSADYWKVVGVVRKPWNH